MATIFLFFIFLQALLCATSSGEDCLEGWTTENTKYRILIYRQERYVSVSCSNRNFTVEGKTLFKCIGGQLPTNLPQCIPPPKTTSSGEDCSEGWTTETTKYRILKRGEDRYVSVSCNNKNFTVDGRKFFKCIGGLLPTNLPHCIPPPTKTSSGEECLEGWTTESTKYRILIYRQDRYVSVSCSNKNFTVDGKTVFKCIGGQLPTNLPQCIPPPKTITPGKIDPPVSPAICERGYRVSFDGRSCVDVDECADKNLNKCHHICRNIAGSFQCLCRDGYSSPDGFRCEDVNECLNVTLNKCNHTCENTVGGYSCSCRTGFVSSDGFRCEGCRMNSYRALYDVACRECPAHSHTDGYEKTSINDCICNEGFTGNPGQRVPCKDIDECADGKKFGCSHTCINTPGSAHCACPSGYQLKEDQKTCTDIDECSVKNGGCDGICHNTDGNFTCSCPEGYVASPDDKYSCDDVDECAIGNGGCSDQCVNFKGGFHCFCSEGHHLHPDGKTCTPVYCPRVFVPHHSTLRCKNSAASDKVIFRPGEMPEDEEFPVEASCRVKCDRGYHIQDAHPAIVCQNDGKWNSSLPECRVLHCFPLPPPSNGDVYPPSCKEGTATVKQKCVFTCHPGYRITGQEVVTCRNNLTWSKKNSTQCVPESEVSISCPDDDITTELMSNESHAEIQLNSPRTLLAAGPIRVRPDWVYLDRGTVFPAGETEVTFSVRHDNKTAECSISVTVLDKHPPIFRDCPENLLVVPSIAGTVVDWQEPTAEDNVGIATVTKSLEPHTTLSPGLHFVEYVARDFAGNIGQCIFRINVTAGGCKDLLDPENGEANCMEWMFGMICQPTCFDHFIRTPELFACDESGTWTPADFISPCLPECFEEETWSPELKKCVKIS